jgi:hypothetical protein
LIVFFTLARRQHTLDLFNRFALLQHHLLKLVIRFRAFKLELEWNDNRDYRHRNHAHNKKRIGIPLNIRNHFVPSLSNCSLKRARSAGY